MRNQRGFTLNELGMVLVVIGVLAAIAVPKFGDRSIEAKQAAVSGVAGMLSGPTAKTAAVLATVVN